MSLLRSPHHDDANTRVALFESLLDLFTLISFILIFAAFIYVARSTGQDQNSSTVVAQIAERGSGVADTLPRDVLLMVIFREKSIDELAIVDGTTGTTTYLPMTVDGIEKVLNDLSPIFARVSTIKIAVYDGPESANPGILIAIQRWLASHRFTQYHIYFTGSQ